jgi:microcystin-dependent protein
MNEKEIKIKVDVTPTQEELVALITPLIPQVKDGKDGVDGKTPTAEEILKLIKPLIPKVKDGKTPTKKELLAIIKPLIPKPIKGEKGEKGNDGKDGVSPSIEDIKKEIGTIEVEYNQIINAPQVEEIVRKTSLASKTTSLSELDDVDISGVTQTNGKYVLGSGGGGADTFLELTDTPSSYTGQALKGTRVNAGETALEFYTTTDSDEKTKVSANDTTAGYLNGKLVAGTGISLTENNDGGNETLTVTNTLDTSNFFNKTTDDTDDITDTATNRFTNDTDIAKLAGIESGAEVNTIDTVSDTTEIDLAISARDLTATLRAGAIDETKLDTSVNASLDLADSALQSADIGVSVQAHSAVLDATTASFTTAEETKLAGIESGAEVNNISDVNATDLTDAGDSTLHYHATDRNRANHTGTQTASTISDFDTEVSNNTDVAANTAARHAAVTVTDSSEIDFTLIGQDITASLKSASIDESKLDTSVNASLDLADTSLQPANISDTAYDATTWNGVTTIAPSKNAVRDKIDTMDTTIAGKQDTLVSGTNIKTINSTSLLGSGDIAITPNATHTGEVTGATSLTLDKTAISNRTDTVITSSDYIIFGDATDSDNLKKDTVQGILDLATGVSDGDKGDITVSASGATWTIDNDVVTYAKIQDVSATDRLLGRDTAGAGDVEELSVSGGLEFTGTGIQRSALTGEVTASAGSNSTVLNVTAITSKLGVTIPTTSDQMLIETGGVLKKITLTNLFSIFGQVPIGGVIDWAGSSLPTGYLYCDGSVISRTSYADLFAVIGTTYGAGDGSTTFALPDARGRVTAGMDNMNNVAGTGGGDAGRLTSASKAGIDGDTLGASGGEEQITLTHQESGVPAHDHAYVDRYRGTVTRQNGGSNTGSATLTSGGYNTSANTPQNASEAHNNVQPTLVLNKIIRFGL